jgi:hypothetical protein
LLFLSFAVTTRTRRKVPSLLLLLGLLLLMNLLFKKLCGDPGLPIRNSRSAYNSRSRDQCVVNPHIRVDNRITSSITVPNSILTIGHMTRYDIATQGKSTNKQRIPSSGYDPRHAYYPTDNWLGDVLVRIDVAELLTIILLTFFIIWPS